MEVIDQFLKSKANKSKEYYKIIGDMMDGGHYLYADDFLQDVYSQIEDTDNITPGQIQAVENIRSKPSRHVGFNRY